MESTPCSYYWTIKEGRFIIEKSPKIFGCVIAPPSFGMTPKRKEKKREKGKNLQEKILKNLKSWCHTKRWVGAATHTHPFFGMSPTQAIRYLFT